MIIGTAIPNNFIASWEFVKCFLQVATKYQITYGQGPYIYEKRNHIYRIAKKNNESLLMIDSDIIFKAEDVEKIEKHLETLDAVTGVYPLGSFPYPSATYRKTPESYMFMPPPDELDEIDACGAGFMGLSSKLIQALPESPFNNVFEKEMHGEDISVCYRIKELGFKLYCDPTIKVGQLRQDIKYYE